jgi:hypothetical protein
MAAKKMPAKKMAAPKKPDPKKKNASVRSVNAAEKDAMDSRAKRSSIYEKAPRGDMGAQRATRRGDNTSREWNRIVDAGDGTAMMRYDLSTQKKMMGAAQKKREADYAAKQKEKAAAKAKADKQKKKLYGR